MTNRNRALRMASEFAVIVIGVFVAVAAESWWSERESRRYEREVREDMVAEFEANLRILATDLAVNDTAHARIVSFTAYAEDQLLALPSAEVTATIGSGLLDSAGFDPEMGAAQALVESGNIGAIGDRELRLLLSRWAGLLEEKRRFNLQAVDFLLHRVTPVIAGGMADGEWTAPERREVQYLLRVFGQTQVLVMDNQRRLQTAAREILAIWNSRIRHLRTAEAAANVRSGWRTDIELGVEQLGLQRLWKRLVAEAEPI